MNYPASEGSAEPNWDKLPQEFHYLIEATRALSIHCGRADEFQPTDEEIELMERTSGQIRADGGHEKILDWVIEHKEFFIVGQVLLLIEMQGFPLS